MIVKNINQLPGLDKLIQDGYITVRKHPSADLWIYNYTAKTQYENVWNQSTRTCRGLIVDRNGDVVARPFTKFFNAEQVDSLPDEPFRVYEKMDGSLGILYWIDGKPYIATRGSFDSEQAQEANKILAQYDTSTLDRSCTYLFEIIYPENRIVVDYGDQRALILLAIIETATGVERELISDVFPVAVEHKEIDNLDSLKMLDQSNFEGFVIRYQSGFRVKVKTLEYLRLHKLITGITEKTILEDYLMVGRSVTELCENVPDEFYRWIKGVEYEYLTRYSMIYVDCKELFASIKAEDRRGYAAAYKATPYPAILFNMLDNKPYAHLIWKMLKPAQRSFRKDDGA